MPLPNSNSNEYILSTQPFPSIKRNCELLIFRIKMISLCLTMVVSKDLYDCSCFTICGLPSSTLCLVMVIYFENAWGLFEITLIFICRRGFGDFLVQWLKAYYFTDKGLRNPEKLSALFKVTQLVSPSRCTMCPLG